MKTSTLIGALLGAVLFVPVANAGEMSGAYLAGDLGLSIPRDINASFNDTAVGVFDADYDLDNSVLFSGAVGMHVMPNVRGEFEIAYSKSDLGDGTVAGTAAAGAGDISRLAFMLNGFYDFKNTSQVTPYLGAGLGLARLNASKEALTSIDDESDTVFAYQLAAGVGYDINENVTLNLGYRWFDTAQADFKYASTIPSTGTATDDFSDHQLRVGLRYNF